MDTQSGLPRLVGLALQSITAPNGDARPVYLADEELSVAVTAVLVGLIDDAREEQRISEEEEWGPRIYEGPLYHTPESDSYYAECVGSLVAKWLTAKMGDA